MGAELPRARIEPRGVGGHLEHLGAEARQHARTAGRFTLFIVRVLGGLTVAIAGIALLVWLAPTPRSTQMQELDRIQRDLQQQIQRMDQARQQMQATRDLLEMPRYKVPQPARIQDLPPATRDPFEQPKPRPRHKSSRPHPDPDATR